ncbi:MAG: alpha-galactosidase [Christensenellaceae bacterium]|jgi:alpha-galactosidase|nr:alpha-galactosidase [Christensenellaceae bacterium]
MFENGCFSITYSLLGQSPKKTTSSNADIEIVSQLESDLFSVDIKARSPIIIQSFEYTCRYEFKNNTAFFANGYQSWTDTREFKCRDKMRDIGFVGKVVRPLGAIFANAGDYKIAKYSHRKGVFHGNGYAYVRNGSNIELFGSLNERNGYTIIYADMNKNKIKLAKDLDGIVINDTYNVFSIYFTSNCYDKAFDAYFAKLAVKPRTLEKLKGYTSWYNYYSNINQEIVLRDLDSLTQSTPEINMFQIDDGYQTAVGDWLSIDYKKFPNGMKVIADAIHEKGLKAGIWLAPLGAELKSKFYSEHPDWLIQENGKPKVVGPNWSNFCGLNFYLPEVREHIRHFFDVVLNEWGYDMVKLDFLYAASAIPLQGKTRAENMYDAMEFIRECVGTKLILGCGVPIMPCFNQVEYMRVGADMGLSWSQGIYGMTTHREDVNTRNAIHNGLMRRHLNGRAFLTDPDVFLLRDYNISHSWEQRKLLAQLIKLTGGVLFVSDDISRYNAEQKKYLDYMFSETNIKIRSIDLSNDVYTIEYEELGESRKLVFSLKNGEILTKI